MDLMTKIEREKNVTNMKTQDRIRCFFFSNDYLKATSHDIDLRDPMHPIHTNVLGL